MDKNKIWPEVHQSLHVEEDNEQVEEEELSNTELKLSNHKISNMYSMSENLRDVDSFLWNDVFAFNVCVQQKEGLWTDHTDTLWFPRLFTHEMKIKHDY